MIPSCLAEEKRIGSVARSGCIFFYFSAVFRLFLIEQIYITAYYTNPYGLLYFQGKLIIKLLNLTNLRSNCLHRRFYSILVHFFWHSFIGSIQLHKIRKKENFSIVSLLAHKSKVVDI